MPLYRDVANYADLTVPFYKRAQITASDLHAAFEGAGFGEFDDLDDLTIFADNLVPHVLRRKGVLVYSRELARKIDAGELIPAESAEEVEIRAGGLHAVDARCNWNEATGAWIDMLNAEGGTGYATAARGREPSDRSPAPR